MLSYICIILILFKKYIPNGGGTISRFCLALGVQLEGVCQVVGDQTEKRHPMGSEVEFLAAVEELVVPYL